MASSGTITLTLKSVDYYGCPAVCYPSTTGRGAITYTPSFSWSVDNSGHFTVSFNGETTGWYVCAQSDNFYLKVQYSTDGVNWYDIGSSSLYHPTCTSTYKVNQMIADLAGMLPTMTLTQSGYARIYTYTGNACPRQCAGDDFPNAYPTEAASQAVAVPVHIDVSWTATIKYNANGGTGAPGNTTATNTGDTQTLTVSNTVPTRKNYRFDGWSYNGNLYHGGDTIVIQKSTPTITLTAAWTKFYHPGAILNGDSQWMSHDREGGACQMLTDVANDTWIDMRTIDAPTGLGDPPAVYHDSKYFNQRKVGKE